MSERTTGATDAQIEDGFRRYADAHSHWSDEGRYGWRIDFTRQAHRVLPYLIPPDHRIIGPADIAALRRALGAAASGDLMAQADFDALMPLIGEQS